MPKAILIFSALLAFAFPSAVMAAAKAERVLPYQNGPAAGWKATVADYGYAPSFMIAVNKQEQLVSVFERKSPLSKIAEYTCTTGQNEGDKLVEGDQKTPEGVYFVVKYINSGLDYSLYGHEAYPLNYPNPVDRIRKKTGSGIWIHGKGIPLVPFDSNGCVGMFNQDIATFKQKPIIGQPVTMAVDIEYSDAPGGEKAATAALLAEKVEAWSRAWSGRSAEMFDFYNPELYSIAQGQSFSAFKAQKERLFKVLPWINTSVSDIQILEGPGYWVTWFNQDYKAPNLSSSGTRRLYWQSDADGELRIVGMEWLNGLKSPVLYAESQPATRSDATVSPPGEPVKQPKAPKPEPVKAAETVKQPEPKTETAQTPAQASAPQKPGAQDGSSSVDAMLAKEGREFINTWQEAWKKRDLAAYARCYADNAKQGDRAGVQAILTQKAQMWSAAKVSRLELSGISIETTENGLKAVMRQDYADSRGYADKGVKILYLEYDHAWRIVREDWKPLVTQ